MIALHLAPAELKRELAGEAVSVAVESPLPGVLSPSGPVDMRTLEEQPKAAGDVSKCRARGLEGAIDLADRRASVAAGDCLHRLIVVAAEANPGEVRPQAQRVAKCMHTAPQLRDPGVRRAV